MSLSGEQAHSFFSPLVGRTSTFLMEGRRANVDFARTLMELASRRGDAATIFDLDAFYSSNSHRIFADLATSFLSTATVRVPEPGSVVEAELAALFGCRQKLIVIDSLNTLYHLISLEDGSSRSRKLSFALAGLGYLARTNAKAVVLSMYRREGFTRVGAGRSISSLSDLTASVSIRGDEVTFRSERGGGWPGGRFSIRIPSG
jgi:hypothetical protein